MKKAPSLFPLLCLIATIDALCEDFLSDSDCKKRKNQGNCNNPSFAMKMLCRKTCGWCAYGTATEQGITLNAPINCNQACNDLFDDTGNGLCRKNGQNSPLCFVSGVNTCTDVKEKRLWKKFSYKKDMKYYQYSYKACKNSNRFIGCKANGVTGDGNEQGSCHNGEYCYSDGGCRPYSKTGLPDRFYDGLCRYGSDQTELISSLESSSPVACYNLCDTTEGCVAFAYTTKYGKNCDLYMGGPYTKGRSKVHATCFILDKGKH